MSDTVSWLEEFNDKLPSDYLKAVIETADWISDYEHIDTNGIFWEVLPGKETDEAATLTSISGLYGGASGIALFFLRLYQVTGEEKYLNKAKAGIDFVIGRDIGRDVYKNL